MKIAGVIAEYNPFHSGHAYHLARTREQTGCDFVVVCMAGSYTQRGEAACLSKWARARMALRCGADAVFELPALYAVRTADVFALGGVSILDGVGVDVLSFGSESGEKLLRKLAALRESEPEAFTGMVQKNLSDGMAHARAWGSAAAKYLGVEPEQLNAPNLILGVEYLRAIQRIGSSMQISTVARKGAYHGQSLSEPGYASATAIRTALSEGRMDEALRRVPEAVREILQTAGSMHAPDDLLLNRLRTMSEQELTCLPDVTEGLEKRVLRCAAQAATRSELIEMLKCKRYTWARLSRLTAHAMLGLTQNIADRHPIPEYARLIGMRDDARPLLKVLKQRAKLPIVSDPTKLADSEIFQIENRATELRALQCDAPEERRAAQEFTQKFIKV